MNKINLLKIVNKKFIVLFLIIFLAGISIYVGTSYGLLTDNGFLSNFVFNGGSLNYKIESADLINNSTIVGGGDELEFTLTLKSKNWVDSNYELYYLIDGENVINEDIEIGYTEESIDKVKGTITARGTKKITVSIKNKSDNTVNITFGCEGSKLDSDIVLSKGNDLNNLIMNDNSILAYTYVGTGTRPTTFPNLGDGYHVTSLTCTGGTAEWDNELWEMNVLTTTGSSLVCNATIDNVYKDASGANIPVIKGDLVPVIISDTGDVTKANIREKWYDYNAKVWANAVILNDGYGPYANGAEIPQAAIEAYFVWIPRFRYKIFDTGSYSSLGTREAAEQEIEIQFESRRTAVSTGSTVGTWLTHPAFTSFDSSGMWVGKFETGKRSATSKSSANSDLVSGSAEVIIKPNVYTWRGMSVGNAFVASYRYARSLDSHMMKNTEWGATTYLSHSKYGTIGRVRINNNSNYVTGFSAKSEPTKSYNGGTSTAGNLLGTKEPLVDGSNTLNYNNTASVVASTTGNYSGIYDMAGGAWEYVMGYTTSASTVGGKSSLTNYTDFNDFFTNSAWLKYYDKYYNATSENDFYKRILGDATGELGPFKNTNDPDGGTTRTKSSWYLGYSDFVESDSPWFKRGGAYHYGTMGPIFAFHRGDGATHEGNSFRVVLTPKYK